MSEHLHRAYGLTISSFIPLDLEPDTGPPAIVARRASLENIGPPRFWDRRSTFAGGTFDRVKLRLPGVFAAEVRDGRELLMDPEPGQNPELLGDYVLQPLLAYAMMQRGHLLFHASAVETAGRAIAFLGAPGQGKSTTAAALSQRGHSVLCDDVLALAGDGRAVPGVRRLKLRPAAAAAVGHDPDRLEQCGNEPMKRRLPPHVPSPEAPVPLHRLYVLAEEGHELRIEVLGAAEALTELIGHSHGMFAIREFGQAEHLDRVARLYRPGLVRRLVRPRDLDLLAALVGLIEDDAGVMPSSAARSSRA